MKTTHYKNIEAFMQALRKMDANVRGRGVKNAVEAGGRIVEAYAKVNVVNTFKHQTGNLANSIRVEVTASPDRAVARIGPTAIYGRIQELGGTVKPLIKKKLYFMGEDGRLRTAMSVTLPARPYLKPAVEEHEDEILKAVAEKLRIEIEGAL